jgi:hypothetical protein
MFDRDHMPYGISLGILFPLAGIGMAFLLSWLWTALAPAGSAPLLRERTLVLLAICLNLIPLKAFNRRRAMQSLRGVVTITTVLGFLWLILYFRELQD